VSAPSEPAVAPDAALSQAPSVRVSVSAADLHPESVPTRDTRLGWDDVPGDDEDLPSDLDSNTDADTPRVRPRRVGTGAQGRRAKPTQGADERPKRPASSINKATS
jgi:hypothetical protein